LSNFFNKIKLSNDTSRIGKNYFFLTLLQSVNFLLPLLTLPYLVRILGANLFGLVMFAQSFALFFNVLVDFGFNLSATREVSLHRTDKAKISRIFSSVMTIKFLLIILSLFIITLLVFSVPRFQTDWKIYYLSFGMVIGQALFPVWYFQGIEKMKIITYINILAKTIFTLLIFIVIKEDSDYLLVPILNAIGFIIAGSIGFSIALKNITLLKPNKVESIKLFRESSQLFVSNLSVTLYTTTNTLILGLFTNNTMVGVYASMEKLVLAIKNLYTPFFQAIFPWVSTKSKNEIIVLIKKLLLPLSSIGLLAFIIIFIGAKPILLIIYDNKLISDYSSIFKILGTIAVFSALNMLFNTIMLSALKMYKERMKIMLVSGITNVILALILVYYFGIYGIAISVAFTEFLLLIFGFLYFKVLKNEDLNNLTNSDT
jgi:PST family polysaccharide transporter